MTSAALTSADVIPIAPPVPNQRAVWRTAQYRAGDLVPGDVTRNSFGKWARVVEVTRAESGPYVGIRFESQDTLSVRDVHLLAVQEVKPS